MKITLKKRIATLILGLVFAFCFAFAGVSIFKTQADAVVYPKNKVELYQLAPSENLYEGYIIKTSNGELVVIDGGADTDADPAYIDAALTAVAGREDYTVKYWFLSHAHSDHIYELAKLLNYNEIDFTIENIVFDFPNFIKTGAIWHPDFVTYNTAKPSNTTHSDLSVTAWETLKTGLENYATKKGLTYTADSYYEKLNGKIVNAETIAKGQVITVDDVDFEILQTWSTRDTQVNSNSMIIRMWVDGQSVLFLNDATVESGNRLIETYGRDFLKSDIVQMAHHGQNGTAKNVYDAVDAKVRLWPCFSAVWAGESEIYQTKEVRTWVGLPENASDFVQTEYDLVAGLCTAPTDATSVSSWEQVLDGMKMELPYLPVYEHDFFMNEGASIRTNSGSTGIRFSATLTSYDPDTQYGFVIAPKSWLDALNVSENYAKSLIDTYGTAEEDGVILLPSKVHQVYNHFEINGSIANILDENIDLDFIGVAYAKKGGVYTDAYMGDLSNIARNVVQVATAARNDHDNDGYEYTSDELNVIDGFISTATGSSEITLEFDQESVNMTVFESKALSITSNVPIDNAIWSSSDSSIISVDNGVVTAHKVDSAEITVKNAGKTATCTVTAVAEQNAIVSFSGKASEKIVRDVPTEVRPSRRSGGLVEAEWLDSYKGANGVVKVTSKAGTTAPYVADVRIELPVAIDKSSGVTVRYMIEKHDAPWFSFYDGSSDGTYEYLKHVAENKLIAESQKGLWKTIYVPFTSVSDDNQALNILIQQGSALFEHVIYFDVIESGDTTSNYGIMDTYGDIANPLKEKLTTPYLADFSDDTYERLIIDDTYAKGHIAEKIVAERLESYDGVKNVMKITTYNSNSPSYFGDFTMVLPKAMTESNDSTEGYTIRFKIGSTTSNGPLRLLIPRSEVSKIKEYNPASSYVGQWIEVFVPYTGDYKNEVTFQIYGNANGENVFYIDYVADGSCVEEMTAARREEQLGEVANNLTGNYLADFSSSVYEYTVGYSSFSTNVASSIKTEYLESHEDANGMIENGVLKITAVAQSNGRGNIVINLPKSSNSGIMTVKFMVPTCNSTYNAFIDPGSTTSTPVSDFFNTTTSWQYLKVDQSSCEKDCIEFLFANNGAVTNIVYIGAVLEGDHVEELKANDLKQANTIIQSTLSGDEIADFSCKQYQMLLADDPYGSTSIAKTKMAEYIANYDNGTVDDLSDDATNLLRVTTTNNSNKYGDFAINLPKEIQNGFTIRFKIESTSGSVFRILKPGTQTGKVYEKANSSLTNSIGEWITVNITLDETYGAKDQIVIQFWGAAENSENVIIIDYINQYNAN
ncbi:MAG: MBL fold metallo-hydrolase [Clostridiales bacterium]|nr:MBL fold metallo-hydrolase [Clostridiales bacterium]